MKYPTIGASSAYRFAIPKLDGGVNAHDAAGQIGDNQLSDCRNMWFRDGTLQTRPGLRCLEDTLQVLTDPGLPDLYGGSYDVVDSTIGSCRKFLEIATEFPSSGTEMVRKYTLHTVGYNGEERYGTPASADPMARGFAFFVESGAGAWEGAKRGGAMLFMKQPPSSAQGHRFLAESDSGGWVDVTDEVYIPHVLINGYPRADADAAASSGYAGEGYNLLTPKFRCTFTSDGKGVYYDLPVKELDDAEVTISYTSREGTLEYTIPTGATESNEAGGYYFRLAREAGQLYSADAGNKPYSVALPDEGLKENVVITAAKTVEGSEQTILDMTFCTWFGGGGGLSSGTRLFVSGNPDKPGLVHWSDVNKPLYFPENNYAYVGNAGLPVTAFGKQGEKLILFKENEIYYTTYNAGTVDAQSVINGEIVDMTANAAAFPIVQLHPSIGCDCPHTIQLCDNRLIWATSAGNVYCLSTANALSETTVHLLSRNVERWLSGLDDSDLQSSAFAFDHAGYYVLMCGGQAFCLNYADSQFLYQVAYSGGKKDGDKLKWYVWEYGGGFTTPDSPDSGGARTITKVVQRVISNGKDALALCWDMDEGASPGYRYLADFSGETDQMVYEGMHIYQIDGREIPCLFQTKLFDMGYPEQEKTVQQVYITASNRSQRTAKIIYLSTRGQTADPSPMEQRETVSADSPQYMSVNRFTPLLSRVHHFGLRVESAGRISVGDIAIKYKRVGRCGR